MAVAIGATGTTGDYVSRLFDCDNVGGVNATDSVVILEALLPGTSNFTVYLRTSSDSAWTQLTAPTSKLLDDGYTEFTFSKSSLSLASTRLKVTMNGSAAYRPSIKSLRCAMLKV